MRLADLQTSEVEQQVPGGQDGLTGRRCALGTFMSDDGRALTCPRSDAAQIHMDGLRPITAQVDAETPCERIQYPMVGNVSGLGQRGGEAARTALPVDERALLLGDRRHREHHVGVRGHRRVPLFETHDEGCGGECVARSRGIGEIVEVDACDDQ
ncbi:UNVERIFIED_ORG: hypothetical protein L601_001100000100 [Gordonia westfalica J30]